MTLDQYSNTFNKSRQKPYTSAKVNLAWIRSPDLDTDSGLPPKFNGGSLSTDTCVIKFSQKSDHSLRRYKPNWGKNALSLNVGRICFKYLHSRCPLLKINTTTVHKTVTNLSTSIQRTSLHFYDGRLQLPINNAIYNNIMTSYSRHQTRYLQWQTVERYASARKAQFLKMLSVTLTFEPITLKCHGKVR